MESANSSTQSPRPIISKAKIKHSSTYSSSTVTGLGDKQKRKKVMFTDRAQNAPLYTIFNYEPVEIISEPESPKSGSCACSIF